ncbi:MAG: DUF2934 domain-containing protein [Terriglobia bacterium]|jgi:hypothetical protein
MPSPAKMMMPEGSTVRESVKTPATVAPTESEIATLAHQLWQDNGCPDGSDKEDWFLAKAMLTSALVAKGQDESCRPSAHCGDTRDEFEMLAELRWEGGWVVWESEWGGARWIWNSATPGVEVSNRILIPTSVHADSRCEQF